jgi:hypothetical protein
MTTNTCWRGRGRYGRTQHGWTLSLLLSVALGLCAVTPVSGAETAPEGAIRLKELVGQLGQEQQARVAPLLQAASTNARVRRSVVLEILLALNPDLVQALAALNVEKTAEALPILEKLGGSPDPFLAKHAAWFRVRALIDSERYEDALAALPAAQTNAARYTQMADEMLYTEGLLQSYLLDRPAAAATLQRFLEGYPLASAEQRGTALRLLDELARVNTNSLPEVITLMNESRRRLHLSDGGDLTQNRQKQVVDILDTIIKKLEKKGGGGGGGGGGGSSSSSASGGQGGVSGGGGGGAKESSLAGGASGTNLERPADGGNPDAWAKAYARDRETVQRELQTRLPDRYRDLIEQYYRSLSTDGKSAEEVPK